MVISRQKLIEKATGAAPVEPESPLASPYGKAMLNTLPTAASYTDFLGATNLAAPAPAGQGLSSKGKYGGFYTTSDLETAIRGEAEQRNAASNAWAESLRNLAAKATGTARQTGQNRYMADDIGELGEYAREAFPTSLRAPAKALFGGYDAPGQTMAPAERRAEEQTYGALAGETLRQKVGAEETASMVEDTPMSVYARAVATQRYGMNPALAAGIFGTDYDVESAKALRDQQALQAGFVDYAEYEQAMEEQEGAYGKQLAEEKLYRDEENRQAAQLASQALGVDATRLASQSGVTPKQLYDALQTTDVAAVTADVAQLIEEGSFEDARTTAEAYLYNPGTEVVGRILNAYINQILALSGKAGRGLQTAADLSAIGITE